MICSREEFLLVLEKWITASQRVVVELSFGNGQLLSGLILGRISGRIASIDKEAGCFTVIGESDDFIMVGLDEWQFAFADHTALPEEAKNPVAMRGEFDEVITLNNFNGTRLSIFTLK